MITIERVKIAFRKLKAHVYFDKTALALRDKVVDFEVSDNFQHTLEQIANVYDEALLGEDSSLLSSVLSSIEVLSFPKKMKLSVNCDNKAVSIGNPNEEPVVKELQHFINMSVEGHILSILWIMAFGKQLDDSCFENAKGNRLRSKLIWKENGDLHDSPALFEPYFAQYSLWRDGGLDCAEELLKKKHDVLIVTLDLAKYYYRTGINEDVFNTILDYDNYSVKDKDEESDRNDETIFRVDTAFCLTQESRYEFQSDKTRIFTLFHDNNSSAVINEFKKAIYENVSEFRLMPEIEDASSPDYFSSFYRLENDATINKLRGIKDITIDKYKLSKYLGKYRIVSRLIDGGSANNLTRRIRKMFNNRELIEHYILWERVFEIFITDKDYDGFIEFVNHIKKAINAIEYEPDLTRDLHCYCVQVNTSEYGDSRITQPKKTEEQNLVVVKGGKNSALLIDEIDIQALREFQLAKYELQKNQAFKPTPPSIDADIVRNKKNNSN